MNLTSRANSLDDLLADVTALYEMECVILGSFLWEVALADICAVLRDALNNTEPLEGLGADWSSSSREQRVPNGGGVIGMNPDLVSLNAFEHPTDDGDANLIPLGIEDLTGCERR